jgi:hypothetical protein
LVIFLCFEDVFSDVLRRLVCNSGPFQFLDPPWIFLPVINPLNILTGPDTGKCNELGYSVYTPSLDSYTCFGISINLNGLLVTELTDSSAFNGTSSSTGAFTTLAYLNNVPRNILVDSGSSTLCASTVLNDGSLIISNVLIQNMKAVTNGGSVFTNLTKRNLQLIN